MVPSSSDLQLYESNRVTFFNFKREQIKNFCTGQCIQRNNFRTKAEEVKAKKTIDKRDEIKKTNDSRNRRNDALLRQLAKSQFKENCFFCHHYAINAHDTIDTPIYCKVRKKTCNPHVARNCKHYQPDMKLISDVTHSQQPN